MGKLIVHGCMSSAEFQHAKSIAEKVRVSAGEELVVHIDELVEVDWIHFMQQAKKKYDPSVVLGLNEAVFCEYDAQGVIGNSAALAAWASSRYSIHDEGNTDFEAMTKTSLADYVHNSENTFVYLTVSSRGRDLGTMAFELFRDFQKASENFRSLCTGDRGTNADGKPLSYLNCPIHRIVKGGWIQSGDILTGNGDSSESIYGGVFEDESFRVHHDRPGILSMANTGPHTNGSQFFVSLRDLEYLDSSKVAFGKLVYGYDTLLKIGDLSTSNQRPHHNTIISKCGIFDPKSI